MFDNEKIICKNPDGIRVIGTVEWLGQRPDADSLQVEQIVYRKTESSPDEYLTVDEGVSAKELWEEKSFVPERIVIDYLASTHSGYYPGCDLDIEGYWIGTREEYSVDLELSAAWNNMKQINWNEFIDAEIRSQHLMQGALTGHLFKGDG